MTDITRLVGQVMTKDPLLAAELQRAAERVEWAHARWLELEDDHSYITWRAAVAWLESLIEHAKRGDGYDHDPA